MKKLSFMFLFIIGIIACLVNCSKEPVYKEFLIKVDSLTTESLQTGSARPLLSVHLYGTISPNGCSSYSHCKSYWQDQDFIIEAWKNVQVGATVCPTVMVYLDQTITFSRDSFPANFILKVKQPDGSYLEKPIE
ncbi:MAG TPA: hypothetical protein PLR88_01820 [Bacteroidales bacterium]|nr:hypothetical protein [Bacteroidales bacterium]HPT20658.1 hypothetical protein [Bacteroidales bacterium]